MVDNQGNRFGAAPDKGIMNGPIISSQARTEYIEQNETIHGDIHERQTTPPYWMENITHGTVSFEANAWSRDASLKAARCPLLQLVILSSEMYDLMVPKAMGLQSMILLLIETKVRE